MPDVTVKLTVADGFSAQLRSFADQIDKAGGATKKLAKETTSSKNTFTELSSALGLAKQAFGAVKGAYDEVVGATVSYAKEVRDLSRTIGSSAEESSKLIQAADDVNISYEALTGALQAGIRKGIKPTIEGIGQIADQYNAIQDPIARTKFLMDNFGRSGAQMGALMELGADGIKSAGDEAERLGLVMSEEGVQSARKYEIAVDNLSDAWMGLKIQMGTAVLPTITGAIESFNTQGEAIDVAREALERGIITQQRYNAVMADVRHGGLQAEKNIREIGEATFEADRATNAYTGRLQGLADTFVKTSYSVGKVRDSLIDHNTHLSKLVHKEEEVMRAAIEASFALQRQAVAMDTLRGQMTPLIDGTEEYNEKVTELTEHIARLEAANGGVIPQAEDYGALQGELADQTLRLSDAQYDAVETVNRLADAQIALAENTDPEKQFKLEHALINATIAAQNAEGRLGDMGGKIGELNTAIVAAAGGGVVDYTKRIAELRGELDELQSKQLVKASDAVFNMGEQFRLSAGVMRDFAVAQGLIDAPTVALQHAFDLLKNPLIDISDADMPGVLSAMAIAAADGEDPALAVRDAYQAQHDILDEMVPTFQQISDSTVTEGAKQEAAIGTVGEVNQAVQDAMQKAWGITTASIVLADAKLVGFKNVLDSIPSTKTVALNVLTGGSVVSTSSGAPSIYAGGGIAAGRQIIVGERGPELLNLPAGGAHVTNNYSMAVNATVNNDLDIAVLAHRVFAYQQQMSH